MSTDAEILSALRRAGEGAVSGADLAQRLGMSRAAIWARIEDLRTLGYEIEASPHQGYRLVSTPDVLHADDLMARLGRATRIIGRDIRVFQETTSTNDIGEKLARDGVKEGVVVFAETQRKGRGRLGRAWVSPPRKGLWFSILLRPSLAPQAATRLTVAASTAVCRGLHACVGLQANIKWPNDILLQGRKIGGILTELSAELDHIKHVVLGIGLDVNLEAEDFPPEVRPHATSIAMELGREINRASLAVEVLRELDAAYAAVCAQDFTRLAEDWESRCITLGRNIRIQVGQRVLRGLAESLDTDGALLVRTEHGHLERIVGGDVVLEKT
jgi:BirA family transcriptional regulator, biotin operon repressor / biotin---[acetyl-CoA-carboxylase] ligase